MRVELVRTGTAHGTPLGCLPTFGDNRLEGWLERIGGLHGRRPTGILLPTLCWGCRGKTMEGVR